MNCVACPRVVSDSRPALSRDVAELVFGFGVVMLVLWVPEHLQIILGPLALAATLSIALSRSRNLDELGLGRRGFVSSLWILPAAVALTVAAVLIAKKAGTLHPLYQPDFLHAGGYVLWTIYQQFLLQVYFMPRVLRILPTEQAAIGLTAFLFATAHLPGLTLTAATLLWGAISCALFLRYRNLYVLGIAQGMLGLAFAICVPDSLHHHLRVGLGYLHYYASVKTP